MRRRLTLAGAGALGGSLAATAPASAHGLAGPPGVPVPGYLFSWGAAAVLVASFAGLTWLWHEPRLETARARTLFSVPRLVDPLCGALGVVLFVLVVAGGLGGDQSATRNLTPTFVYVVFWVALVPVSIVLGDVFMAFNPWRAVGRVAGWFARRATGGRIGAPLPYPARLGRWPAVAGIAAFAWLELAYSDRSRPSTLALAALLYAVVQLVGMAFYGVEAWSDRGDAFGVYFNLFARLSPLAREGRTLVRRPPLSGATHLAAAAGTVALLCTMIGSTSFDGLSGTSAWRELAPRLEQDLLHLGLSGALAEELVATAGLCLMIAIIAGVYRLGIKGMTSIQIGLDRRELARRFAHSLIPIAAGYVLAHYFTFLVVQGQAMGSLISDPFGHGADIFGTAHATIDYGVVSKTLTWYVQVAALLCGHVGGLILAHDRALVLFPDRHKASRSQQWMLTVMVGFTGLGLWLLSSIAR